MKAFVNGLATAVIVWVGLGISAFDDPVRYVVVVAAFGVLAFVRADG